MKKAEKVGIPKPFSIPVVDGNMQDCPDVQVQQSQHIQFRTGHEEDLQRLELVKKDPRRPSMIRYNNTVTDGSLAKYWGQRYSIFSKYDQGIVLDQEGWFSV